ncbi:DNA polymerase sigma [Zalerion maritima]|uniref:polynucleotide adenylyltransferase n=1 Tax=Zalerion maritima TaxID=339359 RepID=A0AAD5RWD1_9PEZI|nr:DNA polymerase sigma [Zalerion maritima]
MGRNNQRHGLPPRPLSSRGSDMYHTSSGRHDVPPPPPSFAPPPPPPPPGQSDGNSRQPRPPQGDFSFRMDMPPAIQNARDYDSYRPHEPRRGRNNRERDRDYRDRRVGGDRDRDRYRAPYQRRLNPYQPPPRASDRKLLKTRHEGTIQDFAEEGEGVTYLSFDDLSDSEEADMDISDSEADTEDTNQHQQGINSDNATSAVIDPKDGPVAKRQRVAQSQNPRAAAEADFAPKWSNPDPYTVIPPPDESRRRGKDVVQLIRRARVKETLDTTGGIKEEADFISFEDDANMNKARFTSPARDLPGDPHQKSHFGNGETSFVTGTLQDKFPTANNSLPARPHLASNDNQFAASEQASFSTTTPSRDLGSRKRTHDDEIKPLPPLPPAKTQKKKNMVPNGSILPEWRIIEPMVLSQTCPWLKDHNDCPAPTILTKEVVDLFNYMRYTPEEHQVREGIITRLGSWLRTRWEGSQLKSFGSFQNGLYLPTGDMDLVLISRRMVDGTGPYFPRGQCYNLARALERSRHAHNNTVQTIAHAKVPLTKFVDSETSLNIDISFDKLDGVNAIQTFLAWEKQYPIMQPLVLIIKHFLAMRGLNEPVNGGIGGFSVICLVVSMLQHDASIQAGQPGQAGELLMKFFRLYGIEFNFRDVAIQTNPPCLVQKNDLNLVYKNLDRISIVDPNNPDNDISGGSSNTRNIVAAFADAYRRLTERLEEVQSDKGTSVEPISILSVLFEGDYRHWIQTRERLKMVYKRQKGTYSNAAGRAADMPPPEEERNPPSTLGPRPPQPTGGISRSGASYQNSQAPNNNRINGSGNQGHSKGRNHRGGGGQQQNRDSRR